MHRCGEALWATTESSTLGGSFIELRRRASDGRISGNTDICPGVENQYPPRPSGTEASSQAVTRRGDRTPIILAGHSYGGAVISEAGNDPKVEALLYIAAFAPDAGESAGSLGASVEAAPLGGEVRPDAQGDLKLTQSGVSDSFAQDLTDTEKLVLWSAQSPTAGAALGG